ncbi:MAG: FAD-binding oxidoreductase [Pseudonocardiales bacterium]
MPGDADYHSARLIWNGDIDRHPAVIARCRTQQDVATAVAFAQREGLEIAVRGGGHGYSGLAVCEGGLMIDLSGMRDVVVDPEGRRAAVGGGASLADLDAATQAHGLAVTGGVVSHTGVAGLTLGGGMGWLTRKLGLAIDNLAAAEVVLADGRWLRASADSHPDLFWALRGGGGNFGVVTSFEFRLHPVGPEVHFALLFWSLDQGHDALRTAREAIPALPENTAPLFCVALNAPPAPFVPEQHHFAPGYALLLVGFGSAEDHAQAVAPIRAACPPLFEFITPISYTALQQMFDDSAFPWGIRAYSKALYLDELSDEAINVLVDQATDKTSPMSFMPIFRLDGAFTQIGEQDTAFGGTRTPQYAVNIEAISPEPAALAADRNWARSVWDALRPFAASPGGYINWLAEQDDDRVRATYGPTKYDRLALIKTQYDPGNIFHRNANITPA